jgi:hypothetical protein
MTSVLRDSAETDGDAGLMHKAGFIPQRVTVRYAASTDLDVLSTFTLYQTSLGFDS